MISSLGKQGAVKLGGRLHLLLSWGAGVVCCNTPEVDLLNTNIG